MKILLICSKAFYDKLDFYKEKLEKYGHNVFMPNCWNCPETENKYRGTEQHSKWKAKMFKQSETTISNMDAVLCLNFDKNGVKNYIGGATFLELYDAFKLNKKIFFINEIPEGILKDELIGFSPIVVNNNLELIK